MAVIQRSKKKNANSNVVITLALFAFMFIVIIYVAVVPDAGEVPTDGSADHVEGTGGLAKVKQAAKNAESKLRNTVSKKREDIKKALDTLSTSGMPGRLRMLRDKHLIVGERLTAVHDGTVTVPEILHGSGVNSKESMINDQPPMELHEIQKYLTEWIHLLHDTLVQAKHATYEGIWQAYHDLTIRTLYPWDRDYLSRMPPRRDDGSIFLSIATYRDENCLNTITNAYRKAKNPDKLFVGLVQQNCHSECKSGVLEGGKIEPVEPDQDCYQAFCQTDIGRNICANNQVRMLDIDEPESLGPYAARYFASKLWYGEQWFMQIDAHMTFAHDWDATSVRMLKAAPSKKPVLSHYPPSHTIDLDKAGKKPASRLCGPIFATSDLESQIIRLEGASMYDKVKLDTPRFAPFTAAGYFVAHSDFLREVPFDPFLPWIFMGEEIIMSTRLWTHGYDIFSPSQAVVGHIYVRRHKPKFWESVHRAFTFGIHNPLQMMVLDRIKYQLGYPEAARDMLRPKSILTAVEQYSMGTERPLEEYLRIVGLNMTTKEVTITDWCEHGKAPPGFEEHAHLYESPKQ